ncbi:hypothetical protein CRUP_010320 [Coryphaenoides rupestris]|nr:hypothetical protein CRUP_010320 [Coryphaenoides rupestris]
MMGQPASVEVQKFSHALISIYLVLAFTPFVTFLIVNVVAEKEQRLKDTMTMMGLYDTAFWLSWGLLYAALVTTMSILMAVIATYTALFPNSSFLVVYLEAQGDGAIFSTLTNGPHPLYVPLLMLVLDSVLYLLLAVYLDQVLPGELSVEAVSAVLPEAVLLVAIARSATWSINDIRKVYKEKDDTVDALRGKAWRVNTSTITALLGHSGAGKSTLMNILCGISQPSSGTATIYGQPVDELADGPEMKRLVGRVSAGSTSCSTCSPWRSTCRLFAAIKGIPPADVDGEVRAFSLTSRSQEFALPEILLLDEPTAGMDPCSRHQVWTLLKNRRAGRVTVLSTHYMDEADILADRKAVISQGQLRCVGSSLYLKTKCGVGYHLRMSVSESCKAESVTLLVNQHVPKAKLSRQQDTELTFTLPFENVDTFPGLFAELDSRSDLGIANYGVSMTTLEDVFLRLEAEAEVDLAVTGPALWRQQFSAVAWLHMVNILSLFLVFVAAALVLLAGHATSRIHSSEGVPAHLPPEEEPGAQESSDISGFIHSLESQDLQVELMKQSDYMAVAPHSAAITVTRSSKQIPDTTSYVMIYIEAIILGMLAAGMPAYFAMDHTRDREVRSSADLKGHRGQLSLQHCEFGLQFPC